MWTVSHAALIVGTGVLAGSGAAAGYAAIGSVSQWGAARLAVPSVNIDKVQGGVSINSNVVIIKPKAVFYKPSHIIAGSIVIAPKIIPFGEDFYMSK